jgi:hypothetical protein
VYIQIYDDPEAEIFTTYKKLIYVNDPWRLGPETLQNFFYSKNAAKTHFRMIPEPYLVQAISPKV